MPSTVLVTGGAGFIGSFVVERLLERGHTVRVYDALVEQVHRGAGPRHTPAEVEFVQGDMRDRDALAGALDGVDRVVHLAAEVGVGQSMYEIDRYVQANTGGTALLLDIVANQHRDLERIVVASSMSIYGEGAYLCSEHGTVSPGLRPEEQLLQRRWEVTCPQCGRDVQPLPTPESKRLIPSSVYAISKMDQELLALSVGSAYGIDVTALRYFNAYGPRQALSNPYTGVMAIFGGRLLNGRTPLSFEDGQQLRDFIHVRDVARATVMAAESDLPGGTTFNVGVGDPLTIADVARTLATAMGSDVEPEITGQYRAGDIRHCYADTTLAREVLGFSPEVRLEEGIRELVEWVAQQQSDDTVDAARAELVSRGLAR